MAKIRSLSRAALASLSLLAACSSSGADDSAGGAGATARAGAGGQSSSAGGGGSAGAIQRGGASGLAGALGGSGGAAGGSNGLGGSGETSGSGDTAGASAAGSAGESANGGQGGASGAPSQGGAGGASDAGCGVSPVTPNATPQARQALCYLYAQYGKHILAGQEENNDDNAMNYVFQTTGKYPAIRSFDVNNDKASSQCVAHTKTGGLCMFGYHMGLANGQDGYDSSMTATDINQVLTEGTTLNTTFKARLDKTAGELQPVQDAGGVALIRLFHEAGGTWFWWSMQGGAQYVRLWKYAFNYLTVTKGLRNLLWLMPYDGSPDPAFYPGKAFVDLGGADDYAGDGNYDPLHSLYEKSVSVFGTSMPIALHECGPIPDPTQLQATGTKWVFFSVWTDNYPKPPSNSVDHLKAVYTSDYVVTKDEMPKW